MYNWSKDRFENMSKVLSQLGHWLSCRSNFLTGIIMQKLGIFHNQPYIRKSATQVPRLQLHICTYFPNDDLSQMHGSTDTICQAFGLI